VRKIVSGVTASRALIEAAIAAGADAIFVHHGLFWRGQDGRVTGWMKQRLALLLAHDINLYAYHLPLDAHPELGNNAQLGRVLGLLADRALWRAGPGLCSASGRGAASPTRRRWRSTWSRCWRPVTLVGRARPIKKIAWCTGGAQGYFEAAIAAGAEAFITGEISEPQAHYARECGVAFWPAATTPPSAMARRRWRPMWRRSWGSSTSSSTSTTPAALHRCQMLLKTCAWELAQPMNKCHWPSPGRPGRHRPGNHRQGVSRRARVLRGCFRGGRRGHAAPRRARWWPGGVSLPVAQIERRPRRWRCRRAACRCCRCRPPGLPVPWGGQRAGRAPGRRLRGVGRARGLRGEVAAW
jgi:dinuclear metal center YbgI/SA1388 family protein